MKRGTIVVDIGVYRLSNGKLKGDIRDCREEVSSFRSISSGSPDESCALPCDRRIFVERRPVVRQDCRPHSDGFGN